MSHEAGSIVRVGITGQSGFIGTHLYNYLGLQKDIERVPFADGYFEDKGKLGEFVAQCDVIVHLAAINRHADAAMLHDTNVQLVEKLIEALESMNHKPHVIFASSTQELRDNLYGQSKKAGRQLWIEWAKVHHASFTGMIIPNVFGPFGKPFYNSVVATFSHQLINGQEPRIEVDAELPLIYVNDLVAAIYRIIVEQQTSEALEVSAIAHARVTDILAKLIAFQQEYVQKGMLPDLRNYFNLCLFNTLRSYLPIDFFPKSYTVHADERGQFVELVKSANGGQTSYSTTVPGVTRGNHFHTRKVERFMVLHGEAVMQLRRVGTDKVIEYAMSGEHPAFVDVPVWNTHNITNVGKQEMITAFWINELFNADDPDTFFENV